jgi:LDH2 family malate/lactate/ureidoglycolate dehydrogenase
MMVDILCALLTDGPISKDIPAMYGAPLHVRRNITHFFLALDVARFVPVARFSERLAEMAGRIRALPASSTATDTAMIAGDPEKRTAVKRMKSGVPVHEETYAEFLKIRQDFSDARIAL